MAFPEAEQWVKVGGWIVLALGIGHGANAVADDVLGSRFFQPDDDVLIAKMKETYLGDMLHAHFPVNYHSGHVGFNETMSLGYIWIGLLLLLCGYMNSAEFNSHKPWITRCSALVVAFTAVYAALYFVWIPGVLFSIAAVCIAIGASGITAGGDTIARSLSVDDKFKRIVLVFAGAILILPGFGHLIAALYDAIVSPMFFIPNDPWLRHALATTPISVGKHVAEMFPFARDTYVLEAFTGFNIAHGMCPVVVGGSLVIFACRDTPSLRRGGSTVRVVVVKCFLIVSFAALYVSYHHFFLIPTLCITTSICMQLYGFYC